MSLTTRIKQLKDQIATIEEYKKNHSRLGCAFSVGLTKGFKQNDTHDLEIGIYGSIEFYDVLLKSLNDSLRFNIESAQIELNELQKCLK